MKVTINSSAALVSKRFDEFEVGDVLLVASNQAVGIKATNSSILFVQDGYGKPYYGNALCTIVKPSHKYLVPREAQLVVVR